ncbi:MAG TPA: ABC transporter substrate-binding protein [Pseudolabrys sp.]|nr:ABC transporter substrate-binding protein [Pseudolabrys sp.]
MTISSLDVSRRTLLGGIAAGTVTMISGGMPVFAQSPTKLLFMEPFDLALEYLHEMNAVVGGHFQKEGLDVTVNNARGTSIAIQQVVAGQAGMTRVGMLDLFKAASAQETPLISVATSLQQPIFSLISLKSAPIKKAADMKGKTIGVASIGGGQENMLNLLLAEGKVPVADVPRQAIGSSAGNVELLKQGRVAGFFATVENTILLKRAGEPIDVWSATDNSSMPGGVILMTKAFTEKNPETAAKFVKAMRNSALECLSADPAMILDRITKKFEISANADRDFRIEAIKAYNASTVSAGKENVMRNVPAVWENGAKLVAEANIAKVADVKALYTNKFVDEAAKS